METDRLRIINEIPDQTRIRLAERFSRLTNKRIDLVKAERTIAIPYHSMASGYNGGSIREAMFLVDHALFSTWSQIQETKDNLLMSIVERERGRLRDFFNVPLDDR